MGQRRMECLHQKMKSQNQPLIVLLGYYENH